MSLLIRACVGRDLSVRLVALKQIPGTLQSVPHAARKFVPVLLHHCASDDRRQRDLAKERLAEVLKLCPDKAVDVLERVVEYGVQRPYPHGRKLWRQKRKKKSNRHWGAR